MARNTRVHGKTATTRMTPKRLSKQQFAQRLYELMESKDWHQSDLARASGLARNNISTYMNARSLPEPKSLRALARVFKVKPEELLPNYMANAVERDLPEFEIKSIAGDVENVWLRVDRMVSKTTAYRVMEILNAEVPPGQ